MLHERSANLLTFLLRSDTPITISELAERYNVSKRTIRNDLDSISDWLNENGFEDLVKRPNVGVYFSKLTSSVKQKIFNALGVIDTYQYVFSRDERFFLITAILLAVGNPVTIGQLAERLDVSTSTVSNDLQHVEQWLGKYDLSLERKPHVGIFIEGNEENYRRALLELLSQSKADDGFIRVLDYRKRRERLGPMDLCFSEIFREVDIDTIHNCLLTVQDEMRVKFNDDSIARLMVHIAVAVKRLKIGYDISMPTAELEQLKKTDEYSYAQGLCGILEKEFNVTIPDSEIGYITIHLLGARLRDHVELSQEDKGYLFNRATLSIASQIVSKAETLLGVDLYTDPDLLYNLALHLKPTLHRLKYGIPISNPILEDFRQHYPGLFRLTGELVRGVLADWAGSCNNCISEEEIGYIAMHLGAALYRAQGYSENNKKTGVLVVCSTGAGTAKLLASRLKAEFNDIVITGTLSYHDLQDSTDCVESSDMIVSTVPLDELGLKYVLVNPLLLKSDIDRLKVSIGLRNEGPNIPASTKKALDVINKYFEISEFERLQLQMELANVLTHPQPMVDILPRSKGPVARQMLNQSTIQVKASVSDWKEAIRTAATPLIHQGSIEDRYVDAMIQAVEDYGPYIVFIDGVAIAHARPQDGVKELSMSLLTLAQPVRFGHEDFDPVDIVLVVGAIDSQSHIQALCEVIYILKDEESTTKIRRARDAAAIAKIFGNNTGKAVINRGN